MILTESKTTIVPSPDILEQLTLGKAEAVVLPLVGTTATDHYYGFERLSKSVLRFHFNDFQIHFDLMVGELLGLKEDFRTDYHRTLYRADTPHDGRPWTKALMMPESRVRHWFRVRRLMVVNKKYITGPLALKCGADAGFDCDRLLESYPSLRRAHFVVILFLEKP